LPTTISEAEMAGSEIRSVVLVFGVIVLLVVGLYLVDPSMCGMMSKSEGFEGPVAGTLSTASTAQQPPTGPNQQTGNAQMAALQGNMNVVPTPTPPAMGAGMAGSASMPAAPLGVRKDMSGNSQEGFANLEDVSGPADFGSGAAPAGCYARDQLTPGELLPKDANSVWAQQNPMGTGSLKGKNFLSAGALVGVNTVGESLRNANYQLRSEPPNPQVPVSVFYNSTIEPDINRRDLEIS
jgi:hypothetical protein